MDWSAEFSRLNLGETRLEKRFVHTLKLFSNRPGDTIAKSCQSWKDAKGAYRLLENDKFDRDKILAVHRDKTIERMKAHPVVLLIQDTSLLNYQHLTQAKGLGVIGSNVTPGVQSKGLIMHSLIAVTPKLQPIGLLDHQTWARVPKAKRDVGYEKESLKWVKSLEPALVAQNKTTKLKLITISDRESDINTYLGCAFESNLNVIVRAMGRRVDRINGLPLADSLIGLEVLGEYELEVEKRYVASGNYRRASKAVKPIVRKARVEVRAQSVLIKVKGVSGKSSEVPFNCVYVCEKSNKKDRLEWILLTSLEIKDFKDALGVIEYYKVRWFIEIFHRTFKSGCGVENSRLQASHKLQNYLLMMALSAVQICRLTYLQRNCPNESCQLILEQSQWEALYLYMNPKAKKPPDVAPYLFEAVTWIARLGGFLARRSDGYPGTLTLWQGWVRLADIHEAYLRFKK